MMRKDEIIALRDRVVKGIEPGIQKKHLPAPTPDSRLYPQDIEGELFWIDRLAYPEWPHTGYGDAFPLVPGLRYEAWYFQKRDTVLLTFLCEDHPALASLVAELKPVFKAFVQDGKYARRYKSVEDKSPEAQLILQVEPNSQGIWRAAPAAEEKLVKALENLFIDTQATVAKAVQRTDPDGQLPASFKAVLAERDPLAKLQARFNRR